MTDNQLIAMIHIAKSATKVCPNCNSYVIENKTCPNCCSHNLQPLDKAKYRELLKSLTAVESTKFMDHREKEKVYHFFIELGFKPKISPYQAGRRRTIGIILNMAKERLGTSWDARLRGFTKSKTGHEELRKCSDQELRMIIGWLRRTKITEV